MLLLGYLNSLILLKLGLKVKENRGEDETGCAAKGSILKRYNIVNDADLRETAQRQEPYLKAQMVTRSVRTGEFSRSH